MAANRLSPLDAAFLYLERPTQPLHVGCVAILDGTLTIEKLTELVDQRLARFPRYRQIPRRPPLDWGLPTWEPDAHYDVRRHVHHVAVPPPQDEAALARVADEVFSVPLPGDRSPWDVTLVDGLAGGRSAIVMKVHHCMIDGVSGAQLLEALSDGWDGHAPAPAAESRTGAPSTLQMMRALLGKIDLHTLAELGTTMTSFVRAPVSALPFNKPLSSSRRVVWAGFDLRDFLAVRGKVGCKINDAVLAVVAGALRRWLDVHGVGADGLRVRAMVPVSVRGAGERLALGNLVSAVFPNLPLDVSDPAERLRRIAQEMAAIKTRQQAQATGLVLGLMGSLPAPIEALLGRLLPDTTLINTICTNVPGPRERCALAGVPISDVHPYVPLFQGMGIEFAILSYADRLSIGAAVDPVLVPDADELPDHLRRAFVELQDAVGLGESSAPRAGVTREAGLSVAALMSSPVLTLAPDDSLERAWRLMAHARVRHLPVVDGSGRLVGLVTHRDLLTATPSRAHIRDEAARVRLLASMSAREVMETHLMVTLLDEPAAVAGERMIAGKIGALPVVERNGRLIGILTTEDLVRWATDHLTRAA